MEILLIVVWYYVDLFEARAIMELLNFFFLTGMGKINLDQTRVLVGVGIQCNNREWEWDRDNSSQTRPVAILNNN